MKAFVVVIVLSITLVLLGAGKSCAYEITQNDINVFSKIFGMSQSLPRDEVNFLIVYDRSDMNSVETRDSFMRLTGATYKGSSGLSVNVDSVEMMQIAGIEDYDVIFFAPGLPLDVQKFLKQAADRYGILTTTTTLSYVQKGYCILGVKLGHTVSVMLNNRAYKDSGVRFDRVFSFIAEGV